MLYPEESKFWRHPYDSILLHVKPDLAIWIHNLLLYPWFLLILDDSTLLAKLVTLTHLQNGAEVTF